MIREYLNNEWVQMGLHSLGDGVIVADPNGNVLFMSPHGAEIAGFSSPAVTKGKDFYEVLNLINLTTGEPIRDTIQKTLARNQSIGLKENSGIIDRNGQPIYLSANCSPLHYKGQTIGVIVTFRNITKYKMYEFKCEEQQRQFQNIFNVAPVGFITLNAEGKVIRVNGAALRMINRSETDILGYRLGNAFGCMNSLLDERGCGYSKHCAECDLRSAVQAAFDGAQGTEIECRKDWQFGLTRRRRWIRFVATPLVNEGVQHVVVTFVDITANKRREIAAAKSRDFFFGIFEKFPTIIWRSDMKQKCLYVNSQWEKLTGQPVKSALGYGWLESVHPEDRENYYNASIDALKNQYSYEAEIRVSDKEGNYHWLRCINRPFHDPADGSQGFVGMGVDITERKQAAEILQRYKILFEHTRDIMLFTGANGRIIEANQAAVETYGYTYNQLLTLNVRDLRSSNVDIDQITQAQRDGTIFEIEHRRQDSSCFPVEISSKGTTIDGEYILLSIVRDISERQMSELALRASQAKYQSLFRNMNSGFAHLYIEKNDKGVPNDLTIIEVNAAFEKIFSVAAENILGGRLSSHFPLLTENFLKIVTEQAHSNGVVGNIQNHEFYCPERKQWYSLWAFEPQNGYLGIIVSDITEKKKADSAILNSKMKYESLFKNMNSGFAYLRIHSGPGTFADCEYIEVNEAYEKIVGMEQEQLIGKRFSTLFPEQIAAYQRVIGIAKKVAAGGGSREIEYYSALSHKWYSTSLYSPRQGYFVAIINDITQRKQAEAEIHKARDEAESASRTKSEFLANMSHEIRTPINGMMGMIDLTLMTELAADQRENLVTAKSCANSLLTVINDVLDFSKLEAGKLTIENIGFSIKELVEEVIRAQSPRAASKGIELNYMFSSAIPSILIGDPHRLRQVLNNLIDNGIKFTDRGEVILSVKQIQRTAADAVELLCAVTDTGIGIRREDMDKLFRTFSQVDGSITRKFGGAGLGLVISKQLAEMMGGKMWAESTVGTGSTFYFTVRCQIGLKLADRHQELPVLIQTRYPQHILLVEDNPVNQEIVRRMVKKMGHTIETADNGREALAQLEKTSFSLILMDIQMPELDGIDTTRIIRDQERTGKLHIPIIALTAHAMQGDRERFLALGMDEYIAKPVMINELYTKIENFSRMAVRSPLIKFDKDGAPYLALDDGPRTAAADCHVDRLGRMIESLMMMPLAEENIETIEAMAHEIKLFAYSLELDDMKDHAFKVELAARRRALEQIKMSISQIQHDFKTLKKIN